MILVAMYGRPGVGHLEGKVSRLMVDNVWQAIGYKIAVKGEMPPKKCESLVAIAAIVEVGSQMEDLSERNRSRWLASS